MMYGGYQISDSTIPIHHNKSFGTILGCKFSATLCVELHMISNSIAKTPRDNYSPTEIISKKQHSLRWVLFLFVEDVSPYKENVFNVKNFNVAKKLPFEGKILRSG